MARENDERSRGDEIFKSAFPPALGLHSRFQTATRVPNFRTRTRLSAIREFYEHADCLSHSRIWTEDFSSPRSLFSGSRGISADAWNSLKLPHLFSRKSPNGMSSEVVQIPRTARAAIRLHRLARRLQLFRPRDLRRLYSTVKVFPPRRAPTLRQGHLPVKWQRPTFTSAPSSSLTARVVWTFRSVGRSSGFFHCSSRRRHVRGVRYVKTTPTSFSVIRGTNGVIRGPNICISFLCAPIIRLQLQHDPATQEKGEKSKTPTRETTRKKPR